MVIKMAHMQDGISGLKSDVARIDHSIQPQLKLIQEGITGILEKYAQTDLLADKVENHDDWLFVLEQERKAQ